MQRMFFSTKIFLLINRNGCRTSLKKETLIQLKLFDKLLKVIILYFINSINLNVLKKKNKYKYNKTKKIHLFWFQKF